MTIHAAKGLEFPVVFVGGLEETLFPNSMSINTREELEEERRLFYVAITRAKHKLWLTYANARYRFGTLQQNEPSRFLNELPANYIDKTFAGGGVRNTGGREWSQSSAFDRMNPSRGDRPTRDMAHRPKEPIANPLISPSPSSKQLNMCQVPTLPPAIPPSCRQDKRSNTRSLALAK
jgi:DNA helicase-2/ATP-dependent DNA helicase PcrA